MRVCPRRRALCSELGVRTQPACVGCGGGVWVVPLFAWYHSSFDTEPDIEGWAGIPPIEDAMMDFQVCRWPERLGGAQAGLTTALAEHFDALNEPSAAAEVAGAADGVPGGEGGGGGVGTGGDVRGQLSWAEVVAGCAAARAAGRPVVSFSHFLPRLELLPEKRFLFLPTLAKAVGSAFLGERVRALRPHVHVSRRSRAAACLLARSPCAAVPVGGCAVALTSEHHRSAPAVRPHPFRLGRHAGRRRALHPGAAELPLRAEGAAGVDTAARLPHGRPAWRASPAGVPLGRRGAAAGADGGRRQCRGCLGGRALVAVLPDPRADPGEHHRPRAVCVCSRALLFSGLAVSCADGRSPFSAAALPASSAPRPKADGRGCCLRRTIAIAADVASNYRRVGPKVACSACNGTGSYKGRGSCKICRSTGLV